jgi:hypothetical protein
LNGNLFGSQASNDKEPGSVFMPVISSKQAAAEKLDDEQLVERARERD